MFFFSFTAVPHSSWEVLDPNRNTAEELQSQSNMRKRPFAPVLTFLAIVLAGCSGAKTSITGTILSTQIDPQNGAVSLVTLSVQNAGGQRKALDFIVRDAQGNGSYWNAVNSPVIFAAGSAHRVELRPQTTTFQPHFADVIAVYAVDGPSGKQVLLGTASVGGSPSTLLNPLLTQWRPDDSAPVDWLFVGTSVGGVAGISRTVIRGHPAATISVQARTQNVWQTAFLQQPIRHTIKGVNFTYIPRRDCDTSPAPRMLAGLEYADSAGNSIVFCVSSAIRRKEVRELSGGHQLVVIVPGKLGEWNTLSAIPGQYSSFVRLLPASDGTLYLRLLVAVNSSTASKAASQNSADFGAMSVPK